MFIRKISEIVGTERDVEFEHKGFKSQRLLLEKDGMGFSFHKTILPKGLKQSWHYKKHLEACYCIEGEAFITNLETGERLNMAFGEDSYQKENNGNDMKWNPTSSMIIMKNMNSKL